MKLLFLLRHAESAEKSAGKTDKQRDLTPKGVSQCKAVGAFLVKKELSIDHILVSTAVRTATTISIIKESSKLRAVIHAVEELYEASPITYRDALSRAPDCQSLMIVGHNPGISAFAAWLSKTQLQDMPTGALYIFSVKENSWTGVKKGCCELMENFVP